MPLTHLAARYDRFLLDLDGCVWIGGDATPGAAAAVQALREAGKAVGFVTNETSFTGEEVVRRLWRAGLRASLEEVVTAGGAMQHLLHDRHSGERAYVIGAAAMHRHVADAGLRVVNGTAFASRADVVVCGSHPDLVFDDLRDGTQALVRGAAFYGTSRDATYPMPDGPWPGTGALLAALETASGRRAETVGKPEAQIFHTALDRLGPGEGPALVVGDRLDADVAGAVAAGLDGALVLTGATSREDADAAMRGVAAGPVPVAVAPTLAELLLVSSPCAA